MIDDKKFKRLTEIDGKMLNGEKITDEEFEERTQIIKEFMTEVDKAYLKHEGII